MQYSSYLVDDPNFTFNAELNFVEETAFTKPTSLWFFLILLKEMSSEGQLPVEAISQAHRHF